MASLTRPFPSMLRPDQGQNQKRNQDSNATPGHPMTITQRDSYCLPPTPTATREVGGTPNNTPAFHIVPVALRMGGGRPIGSGGGGGGSYAHAATPGNTPSSLEAMGKRIAGKLQGGETLKGAGGGQGPSGGSSLGLGARIAPSYEYVNLSLLASCNVLHVESKTDPIVDDDLLLDCMMSRKSSATVLCCSTQ